MNKQTDKYDYAPALVQFSRAIENELREKFFTLYETTTGNQAPLSDKLQTLGRIKDQLRLAANSNPSLTDFKNFLDSTYNSSLIYNEDSFLKRLEVIADKRNKSCHPGTLFTQEMAESAIGEVKRFLSYWTNVIK
ncbi:MAG: hypothetical protein IPH52_04210 [Leptospiraceae bacterium]|nr:hypothetical protein [Leptospiraceae bacterium]